MEREPREAEAAALDVEAAGAPAGSNCSGAAAPAPAPVTPRAKSASVEQEELPGLVVTFQNITYRVPSSRKRGEWATLLEGVTAYLAPGQMTAILGPSGSGGRMARAEGAQPQQGAACGQMLCMGAAPGRSNLGARGSSPGHSLGPALPLPRRTATLPPSSPIHRQDDAAGPAQRPEDRGRAGAGLVHSLRGAARQPRLPAPPRG